jgi:CPA1 family monovalent cation:H+ antiporter
MDLDFQAGALLLLVAAVVAMLSRRLRLPYSVGLVSAGILLAVLPFAPKVSLTKDLIFTGLLPLLLFEASFYIRWRHPRRDLPVNVVLATLGVVLPVAVTAPGMHYFANWQWPGALVFGALIAATDPVSVIATFKEANAQGRLRLLVEGVESVLTMARRRRIRCCGRLGFGPGPHFTWTRGHGSSRQSAAAYCAALL